MRAWSIARMRSRIEGRSWRRHAPPVISTAVYGRIVRPKIDPREPAAFKVQARAGRRAWRGPPAEHHRSRGTAFGALRAIVMDVDAAQRAGIDVCALSAGHDPPHRGRAERRW